MADAGAGGDGPGSPLKQNGQGGGESARNMACDLGSLSARMRHKVVESMSEFSKPVRRKVLMNLGETIKDSAVADPDMCEWVKVHIRRSVGLFWSDLMAFVDIELDDAAEQAADMREHPYLASLGERPYPFSPCWWRARLLYSILPFDKSVFGQAKDPLFWILTAMSMISRYGIRIAFYGAVLFCILVDDPDEFQLVQFIMLLKGTFFLSGGVIGAMRTAWGYVRCVHPGGCHTCDIDGPAYSINLHGQAVDLFGSCALTWIAFICVRWSAHHGWHKVSEKEREQASHVAHGGHLRHLFMYDLACVAASAVMLLTLAYADSDIQEAHQRALYLREELCKEHGVDIQGIMRQRFTSQGSSGWDFHRAFLFARMFYALLSTPFVLFKLPGLNTVLTHTTMTGFNRQGRCVIFCMPPVSPA